MEIRELIAQMQYFNNQEIIMENLNRFLASKGYLVPTSKIELIHFEKNRIEIYTHEFRLIVTDTEIKLDKNK